MQLEIIRRLPTTNQHRPPILFVHGAFAGAWCWDEYFLPYFAEQGYPAYAVSLRGHGLSAGGESLYFASLADYVADVAQVITTQMTQPPILVGHSMGGMVVQKYLERHPAAAMILMNSVPPSGLFTVSMNMVLKDPLLFQQLGLVQLLGPLFATRNMMKRALFSSDIPDEKLRRYFRYMQGESQRVTLDMMGLNLPHLYSRQLELPILVVGSDKDAFIPPSTVKWIANTYKAQGHIFPDIAHAMMLEQNWQQVADYLVNWLGQQTFTDTPH